MMVVRLSEIVDVARAWLGTPYQHQAAAKGQGADCLGLVRGVWGEVYGSTPAKPGAYSADWSESQGEERLWQAAAQHLNCVEVDMNAIGDLLLFRMKASSVAKHLGILATQSDAGPTLIHAYSGRGVVETPLSAGWQRRIVAQFRFPSKG